MSDYIPFNKIFKDNEEQKALATILAGDIWHGNGPVSRRVENYLCDWLDSRHVFLTTSCTHALEMAMMVLEIGHGDEVIMPGFTFVSTANAVCMRGAKPVFSEVRSSDLTIDPDDIACRITPATKAIIPIHYAGVSTDFDKIKEIIKDHDIAIVEDAAHAAGAFWKDCALGTIGDIGCFSFHDTKNITCGEGGAFLTQQDAMAEKAESIREKGTNRTAFLRGEIDKYTWTGPGSSYIPSDLLSAILEVQLQKKDHIYACRKIVWETYRSRLQEFEDRGLILLPRIPSYARTNYHIFHIILNDPGDRNPLLEAFYKAGIEATFHYVPLHNAPYARKILDKPVTLPRTERLADSLIRLPLYPDLAKIRNEVTDRIVAVMSDFFRSRSR